MKYQKGGLVYNPFRLSSDSGNESSDEVSLSDLLSDNNNYESFPVEPVREYQFDN